MMKRGYFYATRLKAVELELVLNVNSVILCISIDIAPTWVVIGIILLDYSHPGASQGGTTGNVDIGGNNAAAVSYTHLTLPTTPYV